MVKVYALIEDGEVIDFQERDDIPVDDWKVGDWRVVKDNAQGVDTEKYNISNDFDLRVLKTKVIKTHEITPLNRKTKKILAQL